MSTYDDGWLHQQQQQNVLPPLSSHFQTFPPASHFIAMGWLEQWRRSKLSRVWKTVLVSLVKGSRGTLLCIQRQANHTTSMESLHQFPIQAVQHVELVDDDRFILHLGMEDNIILRCPPYAVRNWVSTLRLVGQLLVQPATTSQLNHAVSSSSQKPEDINLMSFDNDTTVIHTSSNNGIPNGQPQRLNPHSNNMQLPPPSSVHPPWQQQQQQQPSRHSVYPQHHQQQYNQHQQQGSYAPQVPTWNPNRPNPVPTPLPPMHRPPQMHPQPPSMVPPFPAKTPPIQRAPVSQPIRPTIPAKPQTPLHRSSSAPPEMRGPSPPSVPHKYCPTQVASTPTQTQIQHRVTMEWALRPPAYQCLRDISLLIPSLHQNFALVPHHDYFTKWPIIPKKTDDSSLDKTIRKVRFFLHPDKWPNDLSLDQAYLLKLLWNVMNDAWEEYKKQEIVDD